MSKVYANTFQTFNIYVDRAMEHLTDAELRVLLYATRHIMGWQDKITSRTGCLSLTMFEKGFTTQHENGETSTYGGCGLSRAVISKTLNSLETLGFLERSGFEQDKGQRWRLAENPDWEALETRSAAKLEANRKRTEKATATKRSAAVIVGRTTSTSHDTPAEERNNSETPNEVTVLSSDDNMVLSSDVPKQTQVQTHTENTASANADAPPLTVIHRRNEWYDAILDIWEYTGKMNGAMEKMLRGTATAKAWKEGNVGVALTPQDVRDWAAWYRRTELKGDAHLNMLENRMKIASSIERWDKLGRPREQRVTGYSGIVNIVDPWADAS